MSECGTVRATSASSGSVRIGKIERAILMQIRAAGGCSGMISDHGLGTSRAIDRMEAKGWLIPERNRWRVSEAAPATD